MSRKRIVIASDSFKGTLSSLKICELFKNELKGKDIDAIYVPIADGGEGSLDAISNILKGYYVDVTVKNLYFNDINTHFYVDNNNRAYIETASVAGLTLAKKDNDPGLVTTYGLGQQIKKAIELGYKEIYVFLGGSATNDGGVGLASALGTKFYHNNQTFIPTGLTLKDIERIDNDETESLLKDIKIIALSDVKSPFYGKEGAAFVFAPQKGATPEEVILLDEGLKHLSEIIRRDLKKNIQDVQGAGAAGGLGGGLIAFANATISSGINSILDLINFDEIISKADLVISGEGKLDKQTFDGKVIDGISKRCIKQNKPLNLIVGISETSLEDIQKVYPCINKIYETNFEHLPFEQVKDNAIEAYIMQIKELLKDI